VKTLKRISNVEISVFKQVVSVDSFPFETQADLQVTSLRFSHEVTVGYSPVYVVNEPSSSSTFEARHQTMGRGTPENMSVGDFLPGVLAVFGMVLMFLGISWCFRKLLYSILPKDTVRLLAPAEDVGGSEGQASRSQTDGSSTGVADQETSQTMVLRTFRDQTTVTRCLLSPLSHTISSV
jgi:hypothetical protein